VVREDVEEILPSLSASLSSMQDSKKKRTNIQQIVERKKIYDSDVDQESFRGSGEYQPPAYLVGSQEAKGEKRESHKPIVKMFCDDEEEERNIKNQHNINKRNEP